MSADIHSTPSLRPMLPVDVPVLAAIFQASIEELAEEDYDEDQRKAWAAAADDEAAFGAMLQSCLTIVATLQGAAVGFASLEGADDLKMLYVYPKVARQGIGTLLCDAIEKLAAARGATALKADASDAGRPFFEARGFEAHRRQTVALGDQWLGNTQMQKRLSSDRRH